MHWLQAFIDVHQTSRVACGDSTFRPIPLAGTIQAALGKQAHARPTPQAPTENNGSAQKGTPEWGTADGL